jgi:hypothetical protein
MIWVRIRAHLTERMHERLTEWEHSIVLMVWGVLLYLPPFHTALHNESWWGVVFFVVGVLRFASLVVNGIRRTITSWLRAVCAVVGCILFVTISAGYGYAGSFGLAGLFLVVAMFELFNFGRSMRDVGRSFRVGLSG